jgi:predicted NBD/HSP70 family sugar kinase/biotin operon repressor
MVNLARDLNRRDVLTALLRSRPISRSDIAVQAEVSRATVTRTIDELLAQGIAVEGDEVVVKTQGRRARLVDVVPGFAYAVGLDIRPTVTRAVISDFAATPVFAAAWPTPSSLGAVDLANCLARQLREAAGDRWDRVGRVSVGLPGAVGKATKTTRYAVGLPQVEGREFLDALDAALGLVTDPENTVNLSLVAELEWGAARGSGTAAMINLEDTFGVALAMHGHIVRGKNGLVGEYGHLPMVPMGRALEDYLSGHKVMERAAAAGLSLSAPSDILTPSDDPRIETLVSEFDHGMLMAITAITVSVEPDVIVLAGSLAGSLERRIAVYRQLLTRRMGLAPDLVPAVLGSFAGAVGASVAALLATYADHGAQAARLTKFPGLAPDYATRLAAVTVPLSPQE